MEEQFQRTGASGETVRRCISFFLAAARNSGIPCSPYLRPHRGKKASKKLSEDSDKNLSSAPKTQSGAKKIQLKSGGALTLELSVDLFELDKTDRQFVFDLIDHLNQYSRE
jgi:hypothetical protein